MAATETEPPDKKVDEQDILGVFGRRGDLPATDGAEYAGKWELSSQEVADLVNHELELSDEDGISRQAIHRRLERNDSIVKVKHGRTVTWRLASDELNPMVETQSTSLSGAEKASDRSGHRVDNTDANMGINREIQVSGGAVIMIAILALAVDFLTTSTALILLTVGFTLTAAPYLERVVRRVVSVADARR